MAKNKKNKAGRVIQVSREDNILLKKYFLYNESIGVTLTNSEICDQIFKEGLYLVAKNIK